MQQYIVPVSPVGGALSRDVGHAWSHSIMQAARERAGDSRTLEALRTKYASDSFVVKLQAPRDDGEDSAGGIGQMQPDTLLLYDESLTLVRMIPESEKGHNALLRLANKHKGQVYVNANMDGENLLICGVATQDNRF